MKVKNLQILLILLIPLIAKGQHGSSGIRKKSFLQNLSFTAGYQNGYVFATNDFLRGNNIESDKINAFHAFSLKLSTQATGEKLWEQIFKYPSWGIGVSVIDFYNPEEIGVPVALYGFFNAPFKRWNRWSLNYEIGFGATFNWKSFNPVKNKYNVAIGAGESFLIEAGLSMHYHLTNRFELESGFSLTHFSNGALKKTQFRYQHHRAQNKFEV